MDYGALQGMVLGMLQNAGQRMTLRHVAAGTYSAGSAPLTRTDETVSGVSIAYSDYALANSLVEANDTRMLITASDAPPQVGDEIVDAAARTYTVVRVQAINPAGTPLGYELQVRG